MKRFAILALNVLILSLLLAACAPAATPTLPVELLSTTPVPVPTKAAAAPTSPKPKKINMILATTTSTQDSGLLDVLIPLFEQQTGYKVKVVAVGSGAALQMGQQGNADVLLVHSPSAEKNFMALGYGKERLLVMHNDFMIVGPASDPAHIKGTTSAVEALKKIAAASAPFISRGDQSGTDAKELALWKSAGMDPSVSRPAWYSETGQGMGATLTVASQKGAYTLTDRASYLANKDNLKLEVLVEKDNSLLNVYHVITVNPSRWPAVNYQGALDFAGWITSPTVQQEIGKFGVDKYGEQLFVPDAGKNDPGLGQ